MAGVLVVGDSVAYQFAGSRDPYGIADLADLLGTTGPSQYGLASKGFQVTNGAIPGTGPAREDTLYPLTWADTHFLGALIDLYNPDKVVISFGGNTDVWNGDHTGPEPRLTGRWQLLSIAGFRDILQDARSRRNDRDIVVVAGWRVGPSDQGQTWDWSLIWFGEQVMTAEAPNYPNIKWVDVRDIQGYDSRYRTADNIHLNDAGVSLIADRVAAQLAFDSAPAGGTGPETPSLSVVLPPAPAIPHVEVTDRFRAVVAESHQVVNKLQVRRLDLPDVMAELPVVDGSVTVSSGDATHRSMDVTVITDTDGNELLPGTDLLAPYYCELQLWSGIKYPDGQEELLSVGIFKVTDYECTSKDGGRVHRLTCYDRSIRARGKLGNAHVTQAGVSIEDAATALIRVKSATLPINFPSTGFVCPTLVHSADKTAWGEASKLFSSSGYTLGVNRTGVIVAEPVKLDADPTAAWTFREDQRDVAWDVTRKTSVAANHIIVTSGNTSSAAVRGEAYDADPTSPTWIGGPYGDVIEEVTDERVTTVDQANRAAAVKLTRSLAGSQTNAASCLPNPALELEDTIRLDRTSYALDVFVLVDEYTLPLKADQEMKVSFRPSVQTGLVSAVA